MRGARNLFVVLALAATAAGSARRAQGQPSADLPLALDQGAALPPRAALTAGLGVSYGGFGALGELYLGRSHLSALLGAGVLPGWGGSNTVISTGLRAYTGGSSNRLYVEATGSYLFASDDDDDVYGPAVLVGYSHTARGGFTFNVALGAGRATNGQLGPALDIGVGFTWRQPARVGGDSPALTPP